MPTTTARPSGMRAELRDWYFDDEQYAWHGYVFEDVNEVFRDGQPIKIPSRNVKEIVQYSGEVQILETHGGDRFYMLEANALKRLS